MTGDVALGRAFGRESGFVFVNNYQRLQPMPRKKDVQFQIKSARRQICFSEPAGDRSG